MSKLFKELLKAITDLGKNVLGIGHLQSQDIIVSSSTLLGAKNKSSDGSSFTVRLQTPIEIVGTSQCNVMVKSGDIWFNNPNVVNDVNDKLYLNVGGNLKTIVFDLGLYDFNTLNTQLSILLSNAGAPFTDCITFIAQDATQKVGIKFNTANTTVLFTGKTETIGNIIGFTTGNITALVGQTVFGDTTANFNTLTYFILKCSVVSNGIPINDISKQIIAKISIPLGTRVGSQIIYEPRHPSIIRSDELLNESISSFTVELTDQNGIPINTLNEDYSFILSFSYI